MKTLVFRVPRRNGAFTLLEILLSTALLALLIVILISITSSTSKTWTYTTERIEQFRAARIAFESMTRRLSQATLNTYWDYDDVTAPQKYLRQSELRFISGPTEKLLQNPTTPTTAELVALKRPGHGVFFQAPLGYVKDSGNESLKNLLNTWGYFVEFSDDRAARPEFIAGPSNSPPLRHRYRLMELREPSEDMSVYRYTSGHIRVGANTKPRTLTYISSATPGADGLNGREWFTASTLLNPAAPQVRPVKPIADNILALVILPKLSPEEDPTGAALTPGYEYDSSKTDRLNKFAVDPRYNWKHQLPPVVQVTLIAVDENSYNRFQTGSAYTDMIGGLFTKVGDLSKPDANTYKRDLEQLQTDLRAKYRLNIRVFSTDVGIRAAKWSRDQEN